MVNSQRHLLLTTPNVKSPVRVLVETMVKSPTNLLYVPDGGAGGVALTIDRCISRTIYVELGTRKTYLRLTRPQSLAHTTSKSTSGLRDYTDTCSVLTTDIYNVTSIHFDHRSENANEF